MEVEIILEDGGVADLMVEEEICAAEANNGATNADKIKKAAPCANLIFFMQNILPACKDPGSCT